MARILKFTDFMNESNSRFCDDCSLPIIDSDFKNDFEREASEDAGGLCRRCLIERDPFILDIENFVPHEIDEMGYGEGLEYLLNDDAISKGEEILRKAISLPPTERNMLASYTEIARWEYDHSLFIDDSVRFKVTMLTIYTESKPSSWNPNPDIPKRFINLSELYEKYMNHYRKFLPGEENPYSKSIKNKMDKIDFESESKRALTDEEWEDISRDIEMDLKGISSGEYSKEVSGYEPPEKKEEEMSPSEIDELIDQALDDKDFKEVERLANLKEEILNKISKGRR